MFNTPLCESSILSASYGMSIGGFKTIVEMQFSDFISSGFTAIVNLIAKSNYRWSQNSDIVVTYDIPLASDSIKLGAFVMTPYGKELNPSNIGSTLATRNLMHDIRSANQFLENKNTTFSKKNRSEFSNNLEKLIQKLKKNHINV